VRDVVLDMFRNRDVAPEIFNAVNIFRIDTVSQDSGMTLVNAAGGVTTARNTALEYRYSGNWNRCWMEPGPNSGTIVNNLLASLCPQADQTILILNTTGQGGCARGNSLAVTRTAGWNVLAHEVGHMFGRLGDEYQCNQGSAGCASYTSSEPGPLMAARSHHLGPSRRYRRGCRHFPRCHDRPRPMVDRHLPAIVPRPHEQQHAAAQPGGLCRRA